MSRAQRIADSLAKLEALTGLDASEALEWALLHARFALKNPTLTLGEIRAKAAANRAAARNGAR